MSRTVTGTVKHLDGTAWASGIVKFTLVEGFETSDTVYPQYVHSETLDSNGQFSIDLATPDTGTAHYRVELPDVSQYDLYVDTGVSVDLVTLITVAGSAVTVSAVQTLLDAAEVFTVREVDSTGDILVTDELVLSTGRITLTLPAAPAIGWGVVVKNEDAALTVTVDGDSDDTINGSANTTIAPGWDKVFIYKSTGKWITIGSNP